jgi:hypothetical protein
MHKANSKQDEFHEQEYYSESEAANLLGISIERLHRLLDENIFNDGTKRPGDLLLRYADLILLAFWERGTANPKVIRMPRRN